ncbi:MAG: metallophosphoesterase [Clostridia bacterium]|nr:metallophosphoesterase [Clostridia bacterium]
MAYNARHGHGAKIRSKGKMIAIIIVVAALLAVLAIPFIEPFLLEVDSRALVSSDLPGDVGTLRIVYVSDIHRGPFYSQSRVRQLCSRINDLRPDLLILGGDYAEDSDHAIDFFRNLPDLHVTYAVCAVMGETDRTLPESNLSVLKTTMYTAGVTPVVNEVVPIRIGGGSTIYVAGIDDVTAGSPALQQVAAQVRQDDYVIFASHSPAVIQDSLRASGSDGKRGWYDLGLFGHTHGGQIWPLGKALGFGQNIPDRYMSGWKQENKIDMLISRGVGTSVVPMRLMSKPQIHLITVKCK